MDGWPNGIAMAKGVVRRHGIGGCSKMNKLTNKMGIKAFIIGKEVCGHGITLRRLNMNKLTHFPSLLSLKKFNLVKKRMKTKFCCKFFFKCHLLPIFLSNRLYTMKEKISPKIKIQIPSRSEVINFFKMRALGQK